jgi:hypothetical protein
MFCFRLKEEIHIPETLLDFIRKRGAMDGLNSDIDDMQSEPVMQHHTPP